MAKKILQIIPAPGWFALYKREDGGRDTAPLVCWALVQEDDGVTGVEGMDATDFVELCEGIGNFGGYVHESDIEGGDYLSPGETNVEG